VVNWVLIGELSVSSQWQFFPTEVIAETFRVTTTIQNLDDWNRWKFKSAAYLRFYYPDSSVSRNSYIKVSDIPTIYDLPVPESFRQQGYVIRTPAIIRASRYLPYTTEQNFAQWTFKLEALE
jgi:hypothetical protein